MNVDVFERFRIAPEAQSACWKPVRLDAARKRSRRPLGEKGNAVKGRQGRGGAL